MIWGLTLQPGELHSETVQEEVHVSMAALESRNNEEEKETLSGYNQVMVKTDKAEYVLCTLVHGIQFQQYLDIKLVPGDIINFSVQGKYVVHLTGYSTCIPREESAPMHETHQDETEKDMNHGQLEDTGWQVIPNVKEEPPEVPDEDVIEVLDEPSSELEQDFSKPSVRVPPVRTEQPHYHQQEIETKPVISIQQKMQLQRPPHQQLRPQMQRGRRRFQGPMVQRHRGAAQQRRFARSLPSSTMHRRTPGARPGPRIKVQPAQPRAAMQHTSQQRMVAQQLGQHQQYIPEAANIQSSQDESYPIAVQDIPTSIPGMSQSMYSDMQTDITDIGGGITISDISENEMQSQSNFENVPRTMMEMSGTSLADVPGTSGGDMPRTSRNIPGTSQEVGDQMGQQGDFAMSQFASFDAEGEPSIKCQYCPAQFHDLASYKKHEDTTHADVRSRQCPVCKKILASTSSLKKHFLIHTGAKPYKCRYCGKGLRFSGDVKKHERIHTGANPFKCRYCDRAFNQTGHRKQHEKKYHPEIFTSE